MHIFKHGMTGFIGDATRTERQVVPIDVALGGGHDILVITGPNTGGKTVVLKTIGLLSLMAQSGMAVPAGQGTCLPVFDAVFADIGDEQSLEQSLSTFSSHMTQVARILKAATARSLILLDEMGAGTDPAEGAALGQAILSEVGQLGCLAAVTTHLGDIKKYALRKPKLLNAGVEFDPVSLCPTYRLIAGTTGKSCALLIAKSLDLPSRLLTRARKILRRKRAGLARVKELEKQKRDEELLHRSTLEATVESKREEDARTHQQEKEERRRIRESKIKEWQDSIHAGLEVLLPQFGQKGVVSRVNRERGVAMVKVGLGQWEVKLADLLPPGV